jgi:hypothetical protein
MLGEMAKEMGNHQRQYRENNQLALLGVSAKNQLSASAKWL